MAAHVASAAPQPQQVAALVVTLHEENEQLRAEAERLRAELASVVEEYGALEEDEARRGAEGAALAEAFVETSRVYFGAIRALWEASLYT